MVFIESDTMFSRRLVCSKKPIVGYALCFVLITCCLLYRWNSSKPSVDQLEVHGTVNGKQCAKQLHFHFTKVEKTGSSTLAAIFSRFVLERGIQNVMVMTSGGHLDISKKQGQIPGWDIGPRTSERAEVLIDHARFNEQFIKEHFTADIQLITSVREPVAWFRSAVRFWNKIILQNLEKGERKKVQQDGNEASAKVLDNNLTYLPRSVLHDEYNGMQSVFHLSQLQWLGFDYSQRHDLTSIKQYINYVVSKMNIVILTDQFDASLIMLRRRFCWDHGDIFYKSMEVYDSHHQRLNAALQRKLLSPQINLGEKLLYEAFNQTWWTQPEVMDVDFWKEVRHFKGINKIQERKCKEMLTGSDIKPYTIAASSWSASVLLTEEKCGLITANKYPLMTRLSKYALGYKYSLYQIYAYLSNWFPS